MISAILFDCFGVLTADSWHSFRTKLPVGINAEAQDLMYQYNIGELDEAVFVQKVAALTDITEPDIRAILSPEAGKNTQLLIVIAELKKRGYKIGIISNIANNWVRESFLTEQEQALFDDMVFSYEVGMSKPNKSIFLLAAKRLGMMPEECLFVDDIASYCAAASDVGMTTILYENMPGFQSKLEKFVTKG